MTSDNSRNPYQSPVCTDRVEKLPVADDRSAHWICNTIACYLFGGFYFALLQCACPAVHAIQIPGVVVPFAWSIFTFFAAQNLKEVIVAVVNGALVGGLALLFIPDLMRFITL